MPRRPTPPQRPNARAVQVTLDVDECVIVWRDMQYWCARVDVDHVAACTFDVAAMTRDQANAVIAARGSFVDSLARSQSKD